MTDTNPPSEQAARRQPSAEPVDPEIILTETARYFGQEPELLRLPFSPEAAIQARRIAMYFTRVLTDLSFEDIGEGFGIDPATVERICEEVTQERAARRAVYRQTQDLTQRIRNRTLVSTPEDLDVSLGRLGGKLRALAMRSEPHAQALTGDLSSLDQIKMELQLLLYVVERLLRARELAENIAEASSRLTARKTSPTAPT